ncbi:rhamnosyltransferase [Aeromonas caviae]|uniref:Rhamnosyltransferase n=1 Tax=Aeromonas caviae TaxID=648 RepID=A0A7T4C2W9_AERCA|nr:rhamnosyltransferase [Aeromonas caviae]QQA60735.1 rhamnosyltransferase [Aeromonas caviae]
MRIFSVVVLFNPDLDNVKSLICSLVRQSCEVVIVDNSPQPNTVIELDGVHYQWLGGNKGIAAAQNAGINFSINSGSDYIIFFDQDSMVPDGFISNLYKAAKTSGYRICAPVFFDRDKGYEYPIVNVSKHGIRNKVTSKGDLKNFTTTTAISSGTFVNCSVFDDIGLMNEDLFIDYVDTEWCLRCAKKGILIHVIPSAKMVHAIGDNSIQILNLRVPVHSAFRRYFRVRNSFKLLRMDAVPTLMAIREMSFSLIHSMIIIAYNKDRFAHLKYTFWGVVDGICNKSGGNSH